MSIIIRSMGLTLAAAVTLAFGAEAVRAQDTGPWGGGGNPAAHQADAFFTHYTFRSGETLDKVRIHYETLGAPHRGRDGSINNAVLILHWTGSDSRSLLTPTYMKALFDPGRPLDARRYYLIFADAIGCGRSSKPSEGLKMKFPHYGYGDMVDLQHKLVVEVLGINHLHAILGMSMGGMNAWQWAEAYPDAMDGVMPVVSLPAKVSGRNLIWRRLAVSYVERDPNWNNGDYTAPFFGWTEGYQLLRMMIDGVPHLQAVATDPPTAERFLNDAATQSASGDPNDTIYSLLSSSDYDPEPNLSRIKAKLFALNFSDDEFNPDSLQILERLAPRVANERHLVQAGTPTSFGHLTMAHPDLWAEHVGEFMKWLGD